MSAYVTNLGLADYSGQRTLTLTANGIPIKKSDGTVIKNYKIPALEVQKQGGGFFTIEVVAPSNVNDNTVYKARISSSPGDPNSSNDVATQVGSRQGKP